MLHKTYFIFPYTQNEGDDDIGSNSISKIPNGSRILHVVWGYLASILLHIGFAYLSTRFAIQISSDSFEIMLSSFILLLRSSIRSQNTFFSWNGKMLGFFHIKLWETHIWIYISNFMTFFPWKNENMKMLRLWGVFFRT